jgi:hypothetical protein
LNEHRSVTRSRKAIDKALTTDRDSWGQRSEMRWCISTPTS